MDSLPLRHEGHPGGYVKLNIAFRCLSREKPKLKSLSVEIMKCFPPFLFTNISNKNIVLL